MTKQEIIKEAWGEYYESIKDELDEHGRYNYYDCIPKERKRKMWQFDNILCSSVDHYLLIPTSIKGIEHNNGWIKIQSEEDFPKEQGVYHINYSDGVISSRYFHPKHNDWKDHPNATHYQPIEKPKPPIY